MEQDRLYRRRIFEEVRPLGLRRSIYYGHVPLARDRQLSEGHPRAPLRASRGDRNNIPYNICGISRINIAISQGFIRCIMLYKDNIIKASITVLI